MSWKKITIAIKRDPLKKPNEFEVEDSCFRCGKNEMTVSNSWLTSPLDDLDDNDKPILPQYTMGLAVCGPCRKNLTNPKKLPRRTDFYVIFNKPSQTWIHYKRLLEKPKWEALDKAIE